MCLSPSEKTPETASALLLYPDSEYFMFLITEEMTLTAEVTVPPRFPAPATAVTPGGIACVAFGPEVPLQNKHLSFFLECLLFSLSKIHFGAFLSLGGLFTFDSEVLNES